MTAVLPRKAHTIILDCTVKSYIEKHIKWHQHRVHAHIYTTVPLTILVMASLLHLLQQIGTSSNIINGTRKTIVPQITVSPYT